MKPDRVSQPATQGRKNSRGMSGHQRPNRGASDTWLTPKYIIDALGPFDLDPCCPPEMPWRTASTMIVHPPYDGITTSWRGRVYLNPPFGPEAGIWLDKLADHGNGIALIHARTETRWFHRAIWERADAALFLAGRLHFCCIDGKPAKCNAGAPSVLVAYGSANAAHLRGVNIPGRFIELRKAVA